jgi:mannose-1-phosphate guanylyltransferase
MTTYPAPQSSGSAAPRQALILAAGEGVRLRPLTLTRPKPMLPVSERPLLEHLVTLLRDQGIRDIAINLHYLGEVIRAHFDDGAHWGVHIEYCVEDTLLGSAGTMRRLRNYFAGTFAVIYGDLYTNADVGALAAFHRQRRALLTMALHEADEPTREGIVAVDPATGRVTRFLEKPAPDAVFSRLANAGIFTVEPEAIDVLPPDRLPCDIGHDLIPALLAAGAPVFGLALDGFVLDIGSPERYQEACAVAAAMATDAHEHRP